MTYFQCDGECDNHREIPARPTAGIPLDGIENTDEYFDEIESGKYGTTHVQVTHNVYWTRDE